MVDIWVVAEDVVSHRVYWATKVSVVPMCAKRWVTENLSWKGVMAESNGRTPKDGGPGHQLVSPRSARTSPTVRPPAYKSGGRMFAVADVLVQAVSTTTSIDTRATGRALLVKLEHRHERLLWDLDRAHALQPTLALLLLLQELAFARDITAVALGQHVLAHRRYRLSCDHLSADRGLDRHLVQLARDDRLEPLHEPPALRLRLAAMCDQ